MRTATLPELPPRGPAPSGRAPAPLPEPAALALARQVEAACAQACATIAPAWPLDQAIAVNPHHQRIGLPLRRVAARMALLGGIAVFPPRERQLAAWSGGRIAPGDLAQALLVVPAAQEAGLSAGQCIAALREPLALPRLPLLIDLLDDDPRRHTRMGWRDAITHQVSQTCAAYFDHQQADWRPPRHDGLYAFWRDTLGHDRGIAVLMGLPRAGLRLQALPASREAAEQQVLQRLGLPPAAWADYLEAVLLTVNGWASWCAWLGWQARLQGRSEGSLRELLAIRLAWGALLLDGRQGAATPALGLLRSAWREAPQRLAQAEAALLLDEVWQRALEIGWQRTLAQRLAAAPAAPAPGGLPDGEAPEVQAAFCIDVRSEPLRRALEAVAPGVQTLGVAGFFGLPVAYTPLGTAARRPQLPGLLAPAMELHDRVVPAGADAADDGEASAGPTPDAGDPATTQAAQARQHRQAWAAPWDAATRWPGAAFSFVEALGVGQLGRLGSWLWPRPGPRLRDDLAGLPRRLQPLCRPGLQGLDLAARSALAAQLLQGLGLAPQRGLAPLVLLVGHAGNSRNNAHAAALDCGACCGQSGEVNVRSLARLLNEPAVRRALAAQGQALPETTRFVAALHDTTTDSLEAFDLDLLPPEAQARWQRLQPALAHACDQARRARAPRLGLDPRLSHDALLQALQRRAADGAQTRPEWGLAGNAGFVIAPRARTRGVVLDGRVFLHDYDPAADADGRQLAQLMTAPMQVAAWISWQYHASTCEPARLGSGNKLLHNVVGGRIGVFEGNGGDLRIGLPRQSLHDGSRWVHEPLRLTVLVDAPAERIEQVIDQHAVVRALVDHGWLHLWRFAEAGLQQRTAAGWVAVPGAGAGG